MRFYNCECGKTTSYGSIPSPRCMGCSECGTRPSCYGIYKPPVPHIYYYEDVQTDEGIKQISTCWWCRRTKVEIEGGA